jgi:hypothetical protein
MTIHFRRGTSPFNVGGTIRWRNARARCLSAGLSDTTSGIRCDGNLRNVFTPEIQTVITYSGPYPTLVEYAPGTPAYRSFSYAWDSTSGVLISRTDVQNGVVTTFGYDEFGRQSVVDEAGLRQASTSYDAEHRSILLRRDLRSFGDGLLQTLSRSDQTGRVILVQTSDGAPLVTPDDGIKVSTTHRTFMGGTATVTSSPIERCRTQRWSGPVR